MRCCFCGKEDTKVIDSRPSEDGNSIRRRRECIACGKRFTTYESVEIAPVLIIKRDGRREQFDSTKLKNGIIKACEKCPVSIAEIDSMTDRIAKRVSNLLEPEVPSDKLGEFVMDELKNVNEVAYIRFASVYRSFTDVHTFMEELEKILKEKK